MALTLALQFLVLLIVFLNADGALNCGPTTKPPQITSNCCGVNEHIESHILGGVVSDIDEYPWLALLEYNTTHNKTPCGGVLISSRYVLTAAHCLDNAVSGKPYQVRLSEYNTSSYPTDIIEIGGGYEIIDMVTIGIERQIPHAGYRRAGGITVNDIGLVKLAQNAAFTDLIRPICLPDRDISPTTPPQKLYLATAGWRSAGKPTEIRQRFTLPYVPFKECQDSYSRLKCSVRLEETHICAGEKDRVTACGGHPGGPLMLEVSERSRHDVFLLVGVDTFGSAACGGGLPGVYTHVYKYLDWIDRETV